VAEPVGTFARVFAGTGVTRHQRVSGGAITQVGIVLTFGLVIMSLIYAVSDVSGARFNPLGNARLLGRAPFPRGATSGRTC
jgi:aquaporin Z